MSEFNVTTLFRNITFHFSNFSINNTFRCLILTLIKSSIQILELQSSYFFVDNIPLLDQISVVKLDIKVIAAIIYRIMLVFLSL